MCTRKARFFDELQERHAWMGLAVTCSVRHGSERCCQISGAAMRNEASSTCNALLASF